MLISLDSPSLQRWTATAKDLAALAHAGQFRRGGAPYLTHPATVAAAVPPFLAPIAWLHDACEDSSLTLDDLRAAGLPDDLVGAVAAISKGDGEDYDDYLLRVLANPYAAAVKCADIAHNLSEHPRPASREKYLRALPRLLPVAATVWPEVATALRLPASLPATG
ncbi:MAG: GTP pyrophosphokinase [Verrucomicrobiae bacterium]|nr:GTP pyrophosphokinase [Verrucomicrobiae bacterium]